MSNEVMVVIEIRDEAITTTSKIAISIATQLAQAKDFKVTALLMGENVETITTEVFQLGVQHAYLIKHSELNHYRTLPYTKAVTEVISQKSPTVVIFGGSSTGNDLAPRVAARLQRGLVSQVLEASWNDDKLRVKKAWYQDKLMATFEYANDPPYLMVTSPLAGSAPEPQEGLTGTSEELQVSFSDNDLVEEIVGFHLHKKEVDISNAKLIVSAGRGAGSPEGLKKVFELADILGGEVGASRAIVDAGWISYDHEVGQTGATVAPDIYIACGISGAIQHLAGMKKSKKVIVINIDPEAPFWDHAHYGIVGDMHKIIPILIERFKKK